MAESTRPPGQAGQAGHLRAALLAAASAEAVSATLEGRPAPTIGEITRAVQAYEAGAALAPCTASAATLAHHLSVKAGADPARTLPTGLRPAHRAAAGDVAAMIDDPVGRGTGEGVGPAAWIWPAALLSDLPLDDVAALAGKIAVCSTDVPLRQDTAVAQAVATALAARCTQVEPDVFVDTVAAHVVTPPLREATRVVKMLLRARAEPAFVAAQFPTRRHSPRRCFASALTAFLLHPRDPVATVTTSLAQAGGMGEVAVMAAALSGAHNGENALPRSWRSPAALHLVTQWINQA